jgi:hypothetical protein
LIVAQPFPGMVNWTLLPAMLTVVLFADPELYITARANRPQSPPVR